MARESAVESATEIIRAVVTSEPRVQIFRHIMEGCTRGELEEEFKKPTVSKALGRFQEYALIQEPQRRTESTSEVRIEPTPLADHLGDDILSAVDSAKSGHIYPFLRDTSNWAAAFERYGGISLEHFTDSTVVVAGLNPEDSDLEEMSPQNWYSMLIERSDTIRELVPEWAISEGGSRTIRDEFQNNELRGEIVLSSEAVRIGRNNPRYVSMWEDSIESGNVEYLEYEGDIPFAVSLLNKKVILQSPSALVATSNDEVQSWADNMYSSFQGKADPVTP